MIMRHDLIKSFAIAALTGLTVTLVFPYSGKTSPMPEIDPTEHVAQDKSNQAHKIEIHKFKFQTVKLDVRVGDSVTWINMDAVPHTATAVDKSWDSGRLKKGESFTLIIADNTSLGYFCFYHRQMKAELRRVETDATGKG